MSVLRVSRRKLNQYRTDLFAESDAPGHGWLQVSDTASGRDSIRLLAERYGLTVEDPDGLLAVPTEDTKEAAA